MAGEAAKKSARGLVAPLPLAVRNEQVVRTQSGVGQKSLRWEIQEQSRLRPPRDLGPHFAAMRLARPKEA